MASRAESRLSRLNSAASSLQGPDKASLDEVRHGLLLTANDKYLEMVINTITDRASLGLF